MKPTEKRPNASAVLKAAMTKALERVKKASSRIFNRASAANALMIAFIIMTSVGAWQIYPPIGLIVGGVGCGILGYILGLE